MQARQCAAAEEQKVVLAVIRSDLQRQLQMLEDERHARALQDEDRVVVCWLYVVIDRRPRN